jgi:hypothetical protein
MKRLQPLPQKMFHEFHEVPWVFHEVPWVQMFHEVPWVQASSNDAAVACGKC